MEALWNFFFWQTLTTNPLDNTGHVLRLSIVVNPCSTYQVKPSKSLLDQCNQFLGPTQPGVTTPDPTRTSSAAAAPASKPAASSPPPTVTETEKQALDFLLGG